MTRISRSKKLILSMSVMVLLTAPAAPGFSRTPPPPPERPVVDSDSPVRCRMGPVESDAGFYRSAPAKVRSQPMPTPMPSPMIVTTAPTYAAADTRKAAPGYYPHPQPQPQIEHRERYEGKDVASINSVADAPVSTFSVDVDTGSYANVRRFLTQGQMPPASAVRTEELINYFRYDYPLPQDRSRPFSVTTDLATTPWNADTRLLRIGIRGFDLPASERPPSNLVFLVDVSGSMEAQDKLPLVKSALAMLADRLGPKDKVSIVVYAGAAGIVLDPTNKATYVKQALDCLSAGGSTAGGQGMELAYATAKANFIKGGVNRVIMATDGDFNVGISSNDGIEAIVKTHREAGITLTTLGFGQGNYNEAMMERVADIGNGNYAYIDSAMEAQKVLDEEMASTIFTIAKDVKIQLEFNPAHVKQYRLVGYENRILAEEDFDNDKVDAGDIGSGHQVTALYEIVPTSAKGWLPDRRYEANRVAPQPSGKLGEMAWLKLRYKLPDGDTSMLIERSIAVSTLSYAGQPRGDMAFVTAVAAYGQKLRGDNYLGSYNWADIRSLAGQQQGYLRGEFIKLTGLAGSQQRQN
jgi:Ca-activated chloride channel homolog